MRIGDRQIGRVICIFGLLFSSVSLGQTESSGAVTPPASEAKKLPKIILASDEWCPNVCDLASNKPGLMVEVVREVFKSQGVAVEIKIINWARAIEETRAGRYDGIIGASKKDATDFIYPKSHQGVLKNYVFAPKSSTWKFDGEKSMAGKTLGVNNSYSYGPTVDEFFEKKKPFRKIDSGNNAHSSEMSLTESKRIDGFIEDESVLTMNLAKTKRPVDTFKPVSAMINDDPHLFVTFGPTNKNAQALIQVVDAGMEAIKKSGKFSELCKKYGVSEWKW